MRSSAPFPPILVLGAGQPWRGDDGAGREVARRLRARLPEAAEVGEVEGEASEVLASFAGRETVILVDAARSDRGGLPPGTVLRFDALASPLPADLAAPSSHGFGVAQAIELGRRLGRLPRRLVVYAVVGRDFDFGAVLSPAVESAVEDLVERISAEIDKLARVRCNEVARTGDSRTEA